MTRTRLDLAVAIVVAGILVLGVGAAWQTYRQAQAHGEMMGHDAAVHGPHPVWVLLATVFVASAVGGIYWLVRDRIPTEEGRAPDGQPTLSAGSDPDGVDTAADPNPAADEPGGSDSSKSTAGESLHRPAVLDVLPADERRVLEPVIASPGLTQIELRDRSDFSKSKVSQTVTGLEKRGLLYRERQGRTYRVYPADDLDER